MKFRLIKNITATPLIENNIQESNEYRKFYGNKITTAINAEY